MNLSKISKRFGIVMAAAIVMPVAALAQTSITGDSVTDPTGLVNNPYFPTAYIFGETEASTNSTYLVNNPTRDSGGYGVSPNFTNLGTRIYVGAISDGFFDQTSGGLAGKQGLKGFQIDYDSSIPSFSVTENLAAKTTLTGTSNIVSFGMGAISNAGLISFRWDRSAGNDTGNGTVPWTSGTQFATNLDPSVDATPSLLNLLCTSNGANAKLQIPQVGGNAVSGNDLVFAATFNREIVCELAGQASPFAYTPYGKVLATVTAPDDNRGQVAYNSTIGLVAVVRKNLSFAATQVAVYPVAVSAGPTVALGIPTILNLPSGVAAAQYFSRSPFVGPGIISMNDNGDIVVSCVKPTTAPGSLTSDDEIRNSEDKEVVYFENNGAGYNSPIVAAASGTQTVNSPTVSEFVTTGVGFATKNPTGSVNSVAVSGVSIDNDSNIYFVAANELYFKVGSPNVSTIKTSLFTATPNNTSSPTAFTLNKVLSEQDKFGGHVITFIPLAIASSDLTNANCRFTASNAFGTHSAVCDPAGGIVLACRLTDASGNGPTRWSYTYLAP